MAGPYPVPSSIASKAGAFASSAPSLEYPQYPRHLPRFPRLPCSNSQIPTSFLSAFFHVTSRVQTFDLTRTTHTTPVMFIAQFSDLKARINDLIIKSTSAPSSSSTTSTSASNNASKEPAPPPKYTIKKPSIRLFPETQAPLPTVNVVTKHSHAFNSSKAAGLDKLEQLQFAEVVKGWIIGTCACSIVYRSAPDGTKNEE